MAALLLLSLLKHLVNLALLHLHKQTLLDAPAERDVLASHSGFLLYLSPLLVCEIGWYEVCALQELQSLC